MTKTAIIVLAAGASKRLGTPKQLLAYQNTLLLKYILQQVIAIPNTDVYVVLGSCAKEIQSTLKGLPITILINPNWEKGMGCSLAFGVSKTSNYSNILVTLGDLPLLRSSHYSEILKQHTLSSKGITRTSFTGNIKGVPAVFSSKYLEKLQQLTGDEGARSLIKENSEEVFDFKINLSYIDVDTPKDYEELKKLDLLSN